MKRIQKTLKGANYWSDLTIFQKLYIKRYNKKLKKECKQIVFKFPIGSIVLHKRYSYLRSVTGYNGERFFRDAGNICFTIKNSLCPIEDYYEIT